MAIEQPIELEGTWEEILTHGDELAGRRVRVIVLPGNNTAEREQELSTAASLLKHVGKWQGDDLEECLRLVYQTRSPAQFE